MDIEVEGLTLTISDKSLFWEWSLLKPGDFYVGRRNQGWKLGVFKAFGYYDNAGELVITTTPNKMPSYVYAESHLVYPYDVGECRRVLTIDGEPIEEGE